MPIFHPRAVLNSERVDERDLSIKYIATKLKISSTTLIEIMNGREGITTELAFQISKAFAAPQRFE